jgi:SAM-dependent methyltransferase
MNTGVDVRACPLCGEHDAIAVESFEFDRIWSSYVSDWDLEIDADLRGDLAPAESTALVRCGRCDLRYFIPARAGDPRFYEMLGREMGTYAPARWEFGVVAGQLLASDVVADLGCADGTFLTIAGPRVARAVGVDHNPTAVAAVEHRGFEAYVSDFASFARSHSKDFDVVCAFQTLEHLPDASMLLKPAMALLRSGGRLFISVPNRDRLRGHHGDALDLPPHHLSRWSVGDLATLASRFGLTDVRIALEPPDLSHVRLARRRSLRRHLRSMLGRRLGDPLAGAIAKVTVSSVSHAAGIRAGAYRRRGWFGHSIVASFRVP